jgi:hypothetical protein
MESTIMTHLVDKHVVERANTVLLLSLIGGGLAACAIGAMIYDISYWLAD